MKLCFIYNQKRFAIGGHGWEVVEKYISGQKGLEKKDVIRGEREEGRGERYSYEKADTVPVVVVGEEKKKVHKIWYITLYNKLFGGQHQKIEKKSENLLYTYNK